MAWLRARPYRSGFYWCRCLMLWLLLASEKHALRPCANRQRSYCSKLWIR